MLATVICAILAVVCLTQGAVEGALALGILAAVLYFLFGSKTSSNGNKNMPSKPRPQPSGQEKNTQPDSQYRATPSMVAHYRTSPVVAQIVRDLQAKGLESGFGISRGGTELFAMADGKFYNYVFKDHGYLDLTLQEQEAFLRAIVEQMPYAETYNIGYEHLENSDRPIRYFANTSFYGDNNYRWNPETGAWEQMAKL